MLASFLIIVVCLALFVYWFRYTCLLLVRDGLEQAQAIPGCENFSFREVQKQLDGDASLDPLERALDRDYRVLTYLVRHASGLALESFEERMLMWDYKLMALWYSVTRTAAPDQARTALREMASVLSILAGRLGERAGVHSAA